MHLDPAFNAPIQGPTYAQPLYLDNGPGGRDLVFATTEQNNVYALDATTGSVVWQRNLGAPVPLSQLPCGNIDPLGITGTPVIDLETRTLFVDAMTTPDQGVTKKHLVFGLSIDDLSIRSGWPVDVSAVVTSPAPFNSGVQSQRAGLALLNRTLYVPYGAFQGDCGDYHGWVLGFPLANPSSVTAWHARARGGGVWAPSGVASDGSALFVATGNTIGTATWADGEAILKFASGPVFSGQPSDFFTPDDWKTLDDTDLDLGGVGPVLFTVPGPTPASFIVALGKNGRAYLLDPNNLGGQSVGGLFSATVAAGAIITAAAAYTTSQGSYVVFHGYGANCPAGSATGLIAIKVTGSPPSFSTAWCALQNGAGSAMVTVTDDHANPIVWSVGAEGDHRLRGFDGDTGQVVFAGGGPSEAMHNVRRFQTPIVAKGRIFVAGDDRIFAFRP
jgi:outer membrane protein assembly factor BamB